MSTIVQRVGRRGIFAAAAAVLALGGGLTLAAGLGSNDDGPPQPNQGPTAVPDIDPAPDSVAAPVAPAPGQAPAAEVTDLGPLLAASAPVAIDIPSIEVHSTGLVPLSVGADGVLPAPADYQAPGWYTGGPTPGQLGPAIIAGHVDGPAGPAIFYRLGELVAGDEVAVTRQDGTVARFTIDSVRSYAKAEFPTSLVYGNTTNRAELRLITCGGAFDRATGHYVDNIIAFGHLIA
ncbi:class F sortase [Pengzhenrongella frigida]|uniref:Class F sortase n=1 Tax=Pengzhenrongella frigida TaxID=1259133 RepID=A0A4Q5MVP0_9MICO|nr:class F sortase [Cellulomonas sp. HLT2-17]RYV49549.1 class F sortase [Cellulomonas sp. HLT2-17]